jgi:DNA-binding transcriptional regulator/RsmH inhibitor MraZ
MAGRYEIRLSPKGRVKLRKPFVLQNDRVFLTNHIVESKPCLRGFSSGYWLKLLEELERPRGREAEILRTFYIGGAHELALDKNGSIVIPPPLLKFAGLKERVTLVEMRLGYEEFWLWDPKVHDAVLDRIEKTLLSTDFLERLR